MLLEGMFLPLTTPFYADGRVYLRKMEHNAERYSRTPAAGLALLTESGEAEMLSDTERAEVLRVAAAASAETAVLLAEVSRPAVLETLRLADVAAAAKYDAVLVRVPGAEPAVQRTYLHTVADRSALPVIVVERAGTGGLGEHAMAALARHPVVIGCVMAGSDGRRLERVLESTAGVEREVRVTTVFAAVTGRMMEERAAEPGGPQYVSAEVLTGGTALATSPVILQPAVKTRTKRVGFQVLSGSAEGSLPLLRAGARGMMPPFGACAPQAVYEIYAAWKDGDQGLAEEKLERVRRAAMRIEGELGVAGIKAACDLTGYYGGTPRLPGLPLLGAERREVESLMRGMRS